MVRLNWRMVRLALYEMLHTIGPVRRRALRISATTRGPPAAPSWKVIPPGRVMGIAPTSRPSAMPIPNEKMSISLSFLYESPK